MKKATPENMRVLETLLDGLDGLELPEKVAPHEDKQPPKTLPQKGFVLVSDLSPGGEQTWTMTHPSQNLSQGETIYS